jgi:DNA-binding MarR family transcriptional regulator
MTNKKLSHYLADIILTSHYLAEPTKQTTRELSDAEVRCLRVIAAHEPISMQEIAEGLHASKPRATQLVALLEAYDMVTRTVAQDRRRMDVRATPKGKKAVALLHERYERLSRAIENRLGEQDAARLRDLLEQITPLDQLPLD